MEAKERDLKDYRPYKGKYCICLYDVTTGILITLFSNPKEMSDRWGIDLAKAKHIFCERLRRPGKTKILGTVYRVMPNAEYRILT